MGVGTARRGHLLCKQNTVRFDAVILHQLNKRRKTMYNKEIETNKEESQRRDREQKANASERLKQVAAKVKAKKKNKE